MTIRQKEILMDYSTVTRVFDGNFDKITSIKSNVLTHFLKFKENFDGKF